MTYGITLTGRLVDDGIQLDGKSIAVNHKMMSNGLALKRDTEMGDLILESFPERSPVFVKGNPGRMLLQDVLGRLVDDVWESLQDDDKQSFMAVATGQELDIFGRWFNVPRGELPDKEYRQRIILKRLTKPTIKGIREILANILNCDEDDIQITDGIQPYTITISTPFLSVTNTYITAKAGVTQGYDAYNTPDDNIPVVAQRYIRDEGILKVIVPDGSDMSLLQYFLNLIKPAGIWIWLVEQNGPIPYEV